MAITLDRPGPEGPGETVAALREWQHDATPMQLHPGDVGWFWRFGAEATARALRTWSRDGRTLAVGLLDEPAVLRLAFAPDALQDEALALRLAGDLTDPASGVLPAGRVALETPAGALVRDQLRDRGWVNAEPWAPLRSDLAEPVPDPGVRVEVVGPEQSHVRTAAQRAAFDRSTFTDERWQAMAAGLPYADARCLVARDAGGTGVAAVTVWSAGHGKPGLLEPMGVHRDHRGQGFGRAITVAAAATLRQLGSSAAVVCTPASNVGGVATYVSAGFRRLPDVADLHRPA